MTQFENHDFYDYRSDRDDLTHKTPWDAIEDMVCGRDDIVALFHECGDTITVYAWDRMECDDRWVQEEATVLADRFVERFDDEFSVDDSGVPPEVRHALGHRFEAAIREAVRKCTVWACEQVDSRDYTRDEVLAMAREHRPEWFGR